MNKYILSLAAAAVLLLTVLLPAMAAPEPMFTNINPNAVYNNPPSVKVLTVKADQRPIRVSQILTYHWNNGHGAQPGTISIWENGRQLGAWQAEGRGGSGADNVNWIVYPNITLYPGHSYEIHDSDAATWSWNEASGRCGMFELYGSYQAQAPKTKKKMKKKAGQPKAQPAASSNGSYQAQAPKAKKKEKKQTKQPKAQPAATSNGWNLVYCKTTRSNDDPRVNVFRHTENDGYVRYYIEESQEDVFAAVYNASCTIPPSSVSPGQQIVLELKINMNAKIRDKEKGTYGVGRNLWCSWDPSANMRPGVKMAGELESVKPNGHGDAKVFKCNDGRERNIAQDKTQVFYRFPKEKHGGISIYCSSHNAFGTFMTEFRYE
ncbi:MAG: hypothetical protein Q4F00_09900 [bacterium]|nr:hypothetical protein [bacterium]